MHEEPVVSHDVIGETASCLLRHRAHPRRGRFVKVFGWYDNEWGYVCRLAELVLPVGDTTRGAVSITLDVRIHGRGGQGVVTAAEALLSLAAFD